MLVARGNTMQSGWSTEQPYSDQYQQTTPHNRGRLDQQLLIERCTSAPLPSQSFEKSKGRSTHDVLLGTDLLEHVSRSYFDSSNSNTATPQTSNGLSSQGAVYRDFGSDLFPAASPASGRSTAPSSSASFSSGLGVSRPQSATGSADRNGLQHLDELNALDYEHFANRDKMMRSRSAQPSTIEDRASMRPPPGLNTRGSSGHLVGASHDRLDSSSVGQGIRRPASTGVVSTSTKQDDILRPASKTLMDLIQEDYPDNHHGAVRSHYNPDRDRFDKGSASPAIERPLPRRYDHFDQYEQTPQYHQQQVFSNPSGANPQLYEGEGVRRQIVIEDHGRQMYNPSGRNPIELSSHQGMLDDHRNSYATSIQQPVVNQQIAQLQLEQQINDHHQLGGVTQAVYSAQNHPHRMEQTIPVQQLLQSGQTMLQPGQTMYVNTTSSQTGYGYQTMQSFQSNSAASQQLIHQQLAGGFKGRGEQYVSVVPIQGNGPQLAYWQGDQTQSFGPTVAILNAAGPVGAPITIGRFPSDGHHGGHGLPAYGGRHGRGMSGEKSGRGRRNTHSRRGDSKGGSHGYSSPMLEEFRTSKTRDWTMRHIEGYVLEFCQDQNGSRFIQQRLELGDPMEQEIVMKEVLPTIRRLRNDVFGNYVVQKLLDFGSRAMKSDIRQTLEGEMLHLSLQMYGCRVVQKALETLEEEDLPRILMEFHHNVLSCIHDQNGNHVIQKCIEVMNTRAKKAEAEGDLDRAHFLREQIDFIVNDVLVNASNLSSHPYGCRVLQRILEHCDEHKKVIMLDEIQKCHRKLLDDQYGNYVIQHVLEFGRESDRDSILQIIQENGLLGLSRQKFASNVVEKLLKHGNGAQRRAVAREMLKIVETHTNSFMSEPSDIGKSVAILMVRDAYANYVVQTTLDVVPESEERTLLLKELSAHSEDLRNYTFAKHIVSKLATLNIGDA